EFGLRHASRQIKLKLGGELLIEFSGGQKRIEDVPGVKRQPERRLLRTFRRLCRGSSMLTTLAFTSKSPCTAREHPRHRTAEPDRLRCARRRASRPPRETPLPSCR